MAEKVDPKFPIGGLDQLERYLTALPKNLQRNAVGQGLRAAAAVIRDEIKVKAPKESGALAKSFKISSPTREPDGTISISIRPTGRNGFLAQFHEYGTLPHRITITDETAASVEGRLKPQKSGRGRARKTVTGWANTMERDGTLVISGKFVGPSVQHPGVARRPFIRPAFDNKRDEALAAFRAKIWAYLEKTKTSTGFDVVSAVDGDL